MKKHIQSLTGAVLSAALVLGMLLPCTQSAAAGYFEKNRVIDDVEFYMEDGAPVMSVTVGPDMVQTPMDGVTPDPMTDSNGLVAALLISNADLVRCASDMLAWGYYDETGEYHLFDTSSYEALITDAGKVEYPDGKSDETTVPILTEELVYMMGQLLMEVETNGKTGLTMPWLERYMEAWSNHTFLYPISFGAGYGVFHEQGGDNRCEITFTSYRGVVSPDTPDDQVDPSLDIAGILPDRKSDAPYAELIGPTEYVLIVYPPATGAAANLAIDHFVVWDGESVADESVPGSGKYVKQQSRSTTLLLDADRMTYVPGEDSMAFPAASVVAEDGAQVEPVSIAWSGPDNGEAYQAPVSAGVYEAVAVLGQETLDRGYLAPEPTLFTVEPAQPVLNNAPALANPVQEGDGLEAVDLAAWNITPDMVYPERPEVKVPGSFAVEPDDAFRFDAEHRQIVVTFIPEDSMNYRQASFPLVVTVEAAKPSLLAPVATYFGAVKGADGGYTVRYSGCAQWIELLTVRDRNGRRLNRNDFQTLVRTENGAWQKLSELPITAAGSYWLKTVPVRENGYGESEPVRLMVTPSVVHSICLSGVPSPEEGRTDSLSEAELRQLSVRTDGALLGGVSVSGAAWSEESGAPVLTLTLTVEKNYTLSEGWTERGLSVAGASVQSKTASLDPEAGEITVALKYSAPKPGHGRPGQSTPGHGGDWLRESLRALKNFLNCFPW